MGEVIVTPPRHRGEENSQNQEEQNSVEKEIQQQEESSPISSAETEQSETAETKEEEMNSEEIKNKISEKADGIKEKASEIAEKANRPWVWMLAGAAMILLLLVGTNHLVWTSDGPQLVTMSDAYQAGIQRGIKNVESMPWYSRVWRGFTGDYHSK